jgi:uncharacterized protein YeaO (DUF488 family)
MVKIKRIYDPLLSDDGKRILVDRLWPRGIKKEEAKIDGWLRDIAPSDELRKWFSHDPSKWPEFKGRYKKELTDKAEIIEKLRKEGERVKITLLFSAKKQPTTEYRTVMNELIAEHLVGRKLVNRLVSAKESYIQSDINALKEIVVRIKELVEFYPLHIEKEDKQFFIPSIEYFSKHEKDGMLQNFMNSIRSSSTRNTEHSLSVLNDGGLNEHLGLRAEY